MTLRVILAGLGVRGRHWAEVLTRNPRTEIAAYVDPNPAARDRTAEQYGVRPAFETLDEALNGVDADALVLANPPIGRKAQVEAAAARKLPMLIEKPLALDLAEAAELVEIAESAGVPLMVGLNFRYLDVTKQTVNLFKHGTVGTPSFARFTYERYRDGNRPDLNKYPLTMDQPMLWEQSIHHFDLMRYVYQSEPIYVMCKTWNPRWSMYKSDANVVALFTFENNMVVSYQGTWQSGWSEPHFEWRTDCSNGIVSQHHQFGDLYYAPRANPAMTAVPLPPHEQWITETAGLLEAFVKTVLDGAPLECSGRDHLRSLAMVQACALSSRENRCVSLVELMPV